MEVENGGLEPRDHAPATRRKRKAEAQDHNERLSKRLSLLNLEQSGAKLYVPVEQPSYDATSQPTPPSTSIIAPANGVSNHNNNNNSSSSSSSSNNSMSNDNMQLDDSKYKVYIYNIDDELSSSSASSDTEDSSSEHSGKLVFLSDIEKHLRTTRIPPSVLANSEGQLAGMQLVLYSEPSSLTVPEEQDSVRKAIIEARARHREKARMDSLSLGARAGAGGAGSSASTTTTTMPASTSLSSTFTPTQLTSIPERSSFTVPGFPVPSNTWLNGDDADADAMDID